MRPPGVVTAMAASRWARAARPLAAVVAVLIGAASGSCSSVPASLAPSLSPVPSPLAAETSRDGVRVALTLAGRPQSGALSWADVMIENGNPVGVRWAGGGCGDPAGIFVDLAAEFEPGREWPGLLGRFKAVSLGLGGLTNVGYVEASRVGRNVACTAGLRLEQLAPGGRLTMRAAWDGQILGGAAPAGPAVVEASFPFIGLAGVVRNDAFDTNPIVARLETSVFGGGGAASLAPGLAIDAALADGQFAGFVQAHPEATWINPDVGIIDGIWSVGLFVNGAGGETMFASVKVDQSGTIVGRHVEP